MRLTFRRCACLAQLLYFSADCDPVEGFLRALSVCAGQPMPDSRALDHIPVTLKYCDVPHIKVSSPQAHLTHCNTALGDTAVIRFSAVRSPRFWVSGYAQNDQFKGSFHSSYSRLLNVKTWPRNSILNLGIFRYVR